MSATPKPAQSSPQLALDPAYYNNDEIFAAEKQRIFAQTWRLVGHESMLPNSGDFITDELAGAPLIFVRDEDQQIRGYHNVCRHRAGPLETAPKGSCGNELTCKYHGWRYKLDGRLRAATDFGPAEGFDPRAFGLISVRTERWRGFIFATLSDTAEPATELMAPLDSLWQDNMTQPFALQTSHEIACDWKLYVENYLEGYHVKAVHPTLDAELISEEYNAKMEGSISLHSVPPKDGAANNGVWGWAFPLLGINGYAHGVMMERITPLSANRTRLDYLYFYAPDRRSEMDEMMKLSEVVTKEDVEIVEHVQKNIKAGIYTPGPLSPKHEMCVGWFQSKVCEMIGWT